QYNSAIGPYKGGLRFHPSVNLSILKFSHKVRFAMQNPKKEAYTNQLDHCHEMAERHTKREVTAP
ncbi:MAG: Glu/Leu/Phe/Val dehydrogenase dimerization domain-containing protein, partial [Prevotella sp.]|nr:Glu/Leu/Phe/Val dehydrogenase dimerization domain-containing protein [Prevotella sp.]